MFEGNSMATSLESSEREESVVTGIEKAKKVKGFSLHIESEDDEDIDDLKPASVTQQDETELKVDSEDNEDTHDVDFVSF